MNQCFPIAALALVLCSSANAQTWFPPEATWHHGYYQQPAQNGYVIQTVAADTIIAGQACKRLSRVRESYDQLLGTYSTYVFDPLYVYEANGLVMVYSTLQVAFDTLYWTSAPAGASWGIPDEPVCINCDSTSSITVIDTGHVVLNGLNVRWSAVEIDWGTNGPINYVDTIFERAGLSGVYFLPADVSNGFSDGQEAGPFRCYADTEVALQRAVTCDLIVLGMEVYQANAALCPWPNPSAGELNVDPGCSTCTYSVAVRDALGRMVWSEAKINGACTFDLGRLSNGAYKAQIIIDAGGMQSATWIKQ